MLSWALQYSFCRNHKVTLWIKIHPQSIVTMRPLNASLLVLLQCLLPSLAFHRGSQRSLFSYRNAGNRIQKSFQNNYRNYWHFPSMFGPSQPSGPAVTTSNARGNTRPSVDPGLVTSRASTGSVDPAQWRLVVPSKLASPPSQLASLQWPRFSPGQYPMSPSPSCLLCQVWGTPCSLARWRTDLRSPGAEAGRGSCTPS